LSEKKKKEDNFNLSDFYNHFNYNILISITHFFREVNHSEEREKTILMSAFSRKNSCCCRRVVEEKYDETFLNDR